MINWTTYPLTVLLEELQQTQSEKTTPSHLFHEAIAVFERALNYCHTGNTKVLSTSIMNPLWVSLSLMQDGLPSVNPRFLLISDGDEPVSLASVAWPVSKRYNIPLLASQASNIWHYSAHFNEVCIRSPTYTSLWDPFTSRSIVSVAQATSRRYVELNISARIPYSTDMGFSPLCCPQDLSRHAYMRGPPSQCE